MDKKMQDKEIFFSFSLNLLMSFTTVSNSSKKEKMKRQMFLE